MKKSICFSFLHVKQLYWKEFKKIDRLSQVLTLSTEDFFILIDITGKLGKHKIPLKKIEYK